MSSASSEDSFYSAASVAAHARPAGPPLALPRRQGTARPPRAPASAPAPSSGASARSPARWLFSARPADAGRGEGVARAYGEGDVDDWGDEFESEKGGGEDDTLQRLSVFVEAAEEAGASGDSVFMGESLRLRASEFDAASPPIVQAADAEETTRASVIGIYADPTALKDDWADDFQLETRRVGAAAAPGDAPMTAVMSLLLDQARDRGDADAEEDEYHSLGDADTERDDAGSMAATAPSEMSMAFHAHGDSPLPDRDRGVTWASDLKRAADPLARASDVVLAVRYGEEPGEVPSACQRFLELWARHLAVIELHMLELRKDRETMRALDAAAVAVYSLTNDDDVARLWDEEFGRGYAAAHSHARGEHAAGADHVAKEILLWKLEYARLLRDALAVVQALVAIARFEREYASVDAALETLRAAQRHLDVHAARGQRVDTLRIEVQFETALALRRAGRPDAAVDSLLRASEMSAALAASDEGQGVGASSEQRGLWWAMECKYMLAETFYARGMFEDAVRQYVEYATQGIARMIGLIAPRRHDQEDAGEPLMRYCLFAPRRLALCVWSAALCLAKMGVVEVAQKVGNTAMRTATALDVVDVRVATVDFCGRIKSVLREAKRRQSEALAVDGNAMSTSGDEDRSVAGTGVDLENSGSRAGVEQDPDLDDPMDDMDEDWDAEIEQELNISIQRCSEVTGAHGETLFAGPGGFANPGGAIPGPQLTQSGVRPVGFAAQGNGDGGSANGDGDGGGGAPASGGGASQGGAQTGPEAGRSVSLSGTNNLTEAELRQYLNRLNAALVNMTSQQTMYPKPTESYFKERKHGPKEHEAFLREFVRGRFQDTTEETQFFAARFGYRERADAAEAFPRVRSGRENTLHAQAARPRAGQESDSSSIGEGVLHTDAVRECMQRLRHVERGSLAFAMVHQEAIWNVCRSHGSLQKKRDEIRTLVNSAFASAPLSGLPASRGSMLLDNETHVDRLSKVASLLECLRLARDTLSPDGRDAAWFTRGLDCLISFATTVAPAAKAAIELFRAESRAHFGVVRVTPPAVLDLCSAGIIVSSSRGKALNGGSRASSVLTGTESHGASVSPGAFMGDRSGARGVGESHSGLGGSAGDRGSLKKSPSMALDLRIPNDMRVSVVDVMHGLYWRTKAGVDDTGSQPDALERLVHADVSATLYLVGTGVSPVTAGPLDVSKDESVLKLDRDMRGYRDDTRRVKGAELVDDLRTMWACLPKTATSVRSRVCLALARHAQVEMQDPAAAERLLFDGLLYVDGATPAEPGAEMPRPSLCMSAHLSPLAAVACPLSTALLYEYGLCALGRAKYRYGVAAMEAAAEGLRAREPDTSACLAAAREVATVALSQHDWSRALTWLHDLRASVHPGDGHRNAFVHLCIVLHEICGDVGCFDAADVPLRAYSTLIYEERLRALLHRYQARLAKRARARRRIQLATSVLPSGFPRSRSSVGERSGAVLVADGRPNVLNVRRAFSTSPSGFVEHDEPLASRDRRSSAVVRPGEVKASRSWSARAARAFAGISKRSSVRNTAAVAVAAASVARSPSRGLEKRMGSRTPVHRAALPRNTSAFERTRAPPPESVGASSSRITDATELRGDGSEQDLEELFAIAEEQAAVADSDFFEVELLRAKMAFNRGAYLEAEDLCRDLLEMTLPLRGSRYFVLEIHARIRLKRREITRCLEVIEQMEQEAALVWPAGLDRDYGKFSTSRSGVRKSYSVDRLDRDDGPPSADGGSAQQENPLREPGRSFLPEVAFLRLAALFHGGRLNEALESANDAINACPEQQLWHRAKLHYIRGKVVFSMCSSATAPFDTEEVAAGRSTPVSSKVDANLVEVALAAFETASGYFDAAGDEIGVVKSDLRWSQTVIDILFRRVVLPRLEERESSVNLGEACRLATRYVSLSEVEDVVLSALSFLSAANLPLLMIDALAALAELKCIGGESSTSWSFWVSESWKLFSRLLTDPEEYRVVLSSLAPVSTLMRLKSLCGRLVRLVLCSTHAADVALINTHLGIFEAYITLQVDIDRQMNLASSVHSSKDAMDADGAEQQDSGGRPSPSRRASSYKESDNVGSDAGDRYSGSGPAASGGGRPRATSGWGGPGESTGTEARPISEEVKDRPAGAFLHIIGDEGVALGRLGLSAIINRRGQIMNAIKESHAVRVPRNFYEARRRTKETATSRAYKRNRDAEYIFPFNEKVGLGAMHVLDDTSVDEAAFRGASSDLSVFDMDVRVLDFEELDVKSVSSKRTSAGDGSPRQRTSRGSRADGAEPPGTGGKAAPSSSSKRPPNALSVLVDAVRGLHDGAPREHASLGKSIAERVWAHMHRIKTETQRYSRGEITVDELGQRNGATLRSWLLCVPRSRREWSVPDGLAKRLVYILYAHGVIGYYSVDRGSCVSRLEFGGKQTVGAHEPAAAAPPADAPPPMRLSGNLGGAAPRPPNNAERKFLYSLVKDGRARGSTWFKERESEAVTGLATRVVRAPRVLLETRSNPGLRGKTQKNRPVVLIADLTLQVFPWELFLDHVVIRSLSLLDSIRGLQDDAFQRYHTQASHEATWTPTLALNRRIVRFINFLSPRREGGDLERSEEARRQQLAFQSLLRLNHMSPPRLIACLELGGFSDPTALNAVARPTGPLSTPLTQSTKAVNLLGVRLEARVGRRNYSRLDFVKVPGLGSASTADLRDACLLPPPPSPAPRDLGSHMAVFLFTYADLVDATESVFGLLRTVPRGMLMFAPASKLKIVVRHLEDRELDAELDDVSGRKRGDIVPDIGASTRAIVNYVSRFARSKRIPIVTFLGEGLVEVWPRRPARR